MQNNAGLRFTTDARNSLVRGLAIGRFDNEGIAIFVDDVRVVGCFLGTDASGTRDKGNAIGVFAAGADVAIGNAAPAARNLIAGNDIYGVLLGDNETGARVLGNLIGTNRTGNAPLPNGDGLFTNQTDTVIGGNIPGGGTVDAGANVLKFNSGTGGTVFTGTRNRILRNSIGANGGLGIDLNGDGVSANDANDTDFGANNTQNVPVITAATSNAVQITLNSVPTQNFVIRLYSNPASGDERVRFHGAFGVATDGTGNVGPVTLNPNPSIAVGRSVTATAIRGNGDTSEFSAPVQVT